MEYTPSHNHEFQDGLGELMAGQPQCELCGRALTEAYKGSVCPMCKQEFEALRSQQIKRTAPQAAPVESKVAPRSDDRYITLGTATRTVGPAPDPLPETVTDASSTPPPATPRKLSRQTACVYWTIILVGGFFLVMNAFTIIQEEAFDARRRAEINSSSASQAADRLALGNTVELIAPQAPRTKVLMFEEEKGLYMAYRQRDQLADEAELDEFIQEMKNRSVLVEPGCKARVVERSWDYHGVAYRREDAPCKVEILQGQYKGCFLWALPSCCW